MKVQGHRPRHTRAARLLAVLTASLFLGTFMPGPSAAPVVASDAAAAAVGDVVAAAPLPGFDESVVLSGLVLPTSVEFAADGRVFVAEKSGVLKVYDNLTDPTPTSFSDLTTNVLDLWDRGLLGMTLDPSLKDSSLPLRPWVYVLYTYDHVLGSTAPAPRWGDACPTPPGPTTDGCVASARLSRLTVSGSTISGPEQVLVEDWCQQFTSHSIGGLRFGSDGALYVSAGDGADFNREDWGQWGGTLGSPPPVPKNPCGDPPNDGMAPPTAEGGALRSQDLRTGAPTSGTYNQNVLQDAPLAYWRLGEASGTLADDAVGTRDGTYTGGFTLNQAGALVGDANTAVLLNGTSGYVRVPQIALPSSITLEAWSRATAYPGDTALVGQWSGTAGAMLYVTSDNGGRVHLWINGASISAPAPSSGAWHHIVGTYDGTTARLYIDGGLAAGPTALAGPLVSAPRFFEIGTYNNAGGGKYNGRVDEVAIYPSALSAARIQAHYGAGSGSIDPTSLDGTILRLDPVTGEAFAGNPFVSSPDLNKRRIIAYGLRNPFRFDLRPGTTELWLGDVGWQNWEEINRIADTGDATVENFGWPCYEGVGPQGGYDSANLSICEGLYSEGPSAITAPVFTYNHSAQVVTGDNCPTGGSAISGMVFYPESGGNFPPEYRGGLFFADHARGCIWWMAKGTNGQPDPATRAVFLSPAEGPVDLDIGLDGALYYVDIGGGAVRRVAYSVNNQPPTAVAQASPTSGPLPLTVNFDGTLSSDPEGGPLTYAWDLDADGVFDDSTSATPAWTYSSQATVAVGLRVTDPGTASDVDTIVISAGNTAPTPVIGTPLVGTTWAVGEEIFFTGSASDTEEGTLPASALSWQLTIQHCSSPENCHPHDIQAFPGVASGSFFAPDHLYPSFLELTLTATDSNGLSTSVTRQLDPRTLQLSFQTAPTGLQLSVNGEVTTAPFSRTVIEGSTNSLTAVTPQALGPDLYAFQSWSDGGAVAHGYVATAAATFTATYAITTNSYAQNVLQDAPLAYWRLGEASGTLADDAVGTRDGTYTGGFTLGQAGALVGDANTAVLLNGTSGYVRVPQIALPSSITLEAWSRATAYPGDTALVGQWSGTAGAMLYVTSDNGGRVHLWINGASISAPAPSTGAWHHIVGTYDGTTARLYIDGGLAAGPTALAGPLVSAPRFFEIGTYNNAGGGKYNGRVDEVAIYPSALSAARIQAHYGAGTGPPGNQPPTAVIQANPTSGPLPLTVNFNGTTSTDPEGGPLTYAWDLDGDGFFDDSTSATPSWTYTSQATVTVGLRVTDPGALTDTENVLISAGNSYAQNVLQDAPLAYWRLGEASGTLADDAVGTRDGTYTGGFTLGQAGALVGDANTAVLLNGTSGYVRVPQIALPSSITLEAWSRATAYPGDTALVGQWSGTAGAMLYVTSDNGGRVHLWINGASISAPAPSTGAWHHIVGTYDGTTARLYIDGGLAAGPTALAGPLVSAPRFFEIGTYNNAGGGKYNGRVDEVAIYPSALSAARIQAHYGAGTGT